MLWLILHDFFSMSQHRNLLPLHLTGEATELGRGGGEPVPSQGPDLPSVFLVQAFCPWTFLLKLCLTVHSS